MGRPLARQRRVAVAQPLAEIAHAELVGAVEEVAAPDPLDLAPGDGIDETADPGQLSWPEVGLASVRRLPLGLDELPGGGDDQRAGLPTGEGTIAAGCLEAPACRTVFVPPAALQALAVDTARPRQRLDGVALELVDELVDAGLPPCGLAPVDDVEVARLFPVPVRDRGGVASVDGLHESIGAEVDEDPAAGQVRRRGEGAVPARCVGPAEVEHRRWIGVGVQVPDRRIDVVDVANLVAPPAPAGGPDREVELAPGSADAALERGPPLGGRVPLGALEPPQEGGRLGGVRHDPLPEVPLLDRVRVGRQRSPEPLLGEPRATGLGRLQPVGLTPSADPEAVACDGHSLTVLACLVPVFEGLEQGVDGLVGGIGVVSGMGVVG